MANDDVFVDVDLFDRVYHSERRHRCIVRRQYTTLDFKKRMKS